MLHNQPMQTNPYCATGASLCMSHSLAETSENNASGELRNDSCSSKLAKVVTFALGVRAQVSGYHHYRAAKDIGAVRPRTTLCMALQGERLRCA